MFYSNLCKLKLFRLQSSNSAIYYFSTITSTELFPCGRVFKKIVAVFNYVNFVS